MRLRLTSLVLLLGAINASAAHAAQPAHAILGQHPLFGASDKGLGSQAYDRQYYELGYIYENSSWATAGLQDVRLSGVRFREHKGLLANGLVLLLIYPGGLLDGLFKSNAIFEDPVAADRVRRDLVRGIETGESSLPISMDLQFFSAATGSEMTGLVGEIGFGGPFTLLDDVLVLVWGFNFAAGWLWTNHLFKPSADGGSAPVTEPLERSWLGVNLDARLLVPMFPHVTFRGRFTAAHSAQWLQLFEFGPEVAIGDRFQVRGLATKDVGPSGAPLSARFELGVRF